MNIALLLSFFYLVSLFGFGLPNYHKLDKLTRTNGDVWQLQIKYHFLFLYFSYICYLYLDKIKHNRKIRFYERELHYLSLFEYKNDAELAKQALFERILKIEYLKRKQRKKKNNLIYKIKKIYDYISKRLHKNIKETTTM